MTTINLKGSFRKGPTKLAVVAALGTLLASFTGSALVERMEKYAAEDRLSVGTTTSTCAHAACSSSHLALD